MRNVPRRFRIAFMSESGGFRQDRTFAEGNFMRRTMAKFGSESVLDLYNLLLGVVLFASPWFFAHASRAAGFDLWLSSAAIIILSIAAMIAYSTWEEWINLALGLWLVVSPYLLGFAHTRAMHFAIGIGSAIAFFAALELWLRYEARQNAMAPGNEASGNRIPGETISHPAGH